MTMAIWLEKRQFWQNKIEKQNKKKQKKNQIKQKQKQRWPIVWSQQPLC